MVLSYLIATVTDLPKSGGGVGPRHTPLVPPFSDFIYFRSDCSASCGGGKRKRERLCKESLFPPKNAQWTKRTIDSYGSLALLPRAQEKTFDTRRVLDPKLCKRGKPTDLGTCNKHTCPGKTGPLPFGMFVSFSSIKIDLKFTTIKYL